MLVLTRKVGESVRVGDARIVIVKAGRGTVRLGIEAPREVEIVRSELENDAGRAAAVSNPVEVDAATVLTDSRRVVRCDRRDDSSEWGILFRPLKMLRRRNPDAGNTARLNPGFPV